VRLESGGRIILSPQNDAVLHNSAVGIWFALKVVADNTCERYEPILIQHLAGCSSCSR